MIRTNGKISRKLLGWACAAFMMTTVGQVTGMGQEAETGAARIHSLVGGENVAEKPNFVVSPFSVLSVFSMAQQGASGATHEQMSRVIASTASFGLPKFSSDGRQQTIVEAANGLYVSDELAHNKVFKKFSAGVTAKYEAVAQVMDFGDGVSAARAVNEYIAKTTRDHIKNLVSSSNFTPLTRMALVNALYFKAAWLSQFDADVTEKNTFHAVTSLGPVDQSVDFMQQTVKGAAMYFEDSTATVVGLQYKDTKLVMYLIQPTDIVEFEAKAAGNSAFLTDYVTKARNSMGELSECNLKLTMPKFKLSAADNKADLKPLFMKLGCTDMFNETLADFSGMSGDRSLYASLFMHQADIEVDEKGTEATAATVMLVQTRMALRPMPQRTEIAVKINKPFIFQVRVQDTSEQKPGHVLFTGRVADAAAAQANL